MPEEMSLAVFDPPKAMVADLVKKDASQDFDHTTPEGETALRSWVHRVRGGKGDIEKIRVAAKADALAYGKKVDALAKELKAPLEKIITERMKPLDAIEDAKRKAAEAVVEAERVAKETEEAGRIADLKRREEEVARKEAEIKATEQAANAKQAEVARVAREKGIAAEAAEKATKEAEAKAQAEAAEKEKARLAAEATARLKTQQAEQAEKRRIENEANRTKVERGIQSALYDVLDESRETTDEAVDSVFSAIRGGDIPNVTINY